MHVLEHGQGAAHCYQTSKVVILSALSVLVAVFDPSFDELCVGEDNEKVSLTVSAKLFHFVTYVFSSHFLPLCQLYNCRSVLVRETFHAEG